MLPCASASMTVSTCSCNGGRCVLDAHSALLNSQQVQPNLIQSQAALHGVGQRFLNFAAYQQAVHSLTEGHCSLKKRLQLSGCTLPNMFKDSKAHQKEHCLVQASSWSTGAPLVRRASPLVTAWPLGQCRACWQPLPPSQWRLSGER